MAEVPNVALFLNELAQGLRPVSDGPSWCSERSELEKRQTLRQLAAYSLEARATQGDARQAITDAGIKPTHTPAVLVVKGDLREQAYKLPIWCRSNKKEPSDFCSPRARL
jgi:hypothetical protein